MRVQAAVSAADFVVVVVVLAAAVSLAIFDREAVPVVVGYWAVQDFENVSYAPDFLPLSWILVNQDLGNLYRGKEGRGNFER